MPAERRARSDPGRAQAWAAGVCAAGESANTTHLTVADADGRIRCDPQTINSLFGARFLVPELGLIPNNYMALFDPRPGHALSIAPGKRITTSQAPLIALRDGAAGLGPRLTRWPAASSAPPWQALVNLIDHGMSLQEAVEAPRIWTRGRASRSRAASASGARGRAAAMRP